MIAEQSLSRRRRRRSRYLRGDSWMFWTLLSLQAALLWWALGGGQLP